jgi:hypothetical protein
LETATLTVAGTPGGSTAHALTGTGLPPGLLTLTQPVFPTTAVGSMSTATSVTVTNTGGSAVGTPTTMLGGSNPGDFSVTAGTCTAGLNPGQSCVLSVKFAPTAPGTRDATLQVSATGTTPASVNLSGTATTLLTVSKTGMGTITAAPTGLSACAPAMTSCTGTYSTTTVTLTASPAAGYTFSNWTGGGCSGNNPTCNATLSGASTTVTATFNMIPAATLTIDKPTGYDFGSLVMSSPGGPVVFTITNTGTLVSGSMSTSVTGPGASQFTIVSDACSGLVLGPGVSCKVTLAFDPTAIGSFAPTLTVTANPGGPASSPLTGIGTSPVAIIPVASHDWGPINQGSSSQFTFKLENLGLASIDGTNWTGAVTGANPGDFTVSIPGTTSTYCGYSTPLAPGRTCQFVITFIPQAGGARSAIVTLNDGLGRSIQIPVTGTGVPSAATVSITPATQDFGAIVTGATSPQIVFTVSNDGATGVTVQRSVTSTDFVIDPPTGSDCLAGNTSLSPGATCSVKVRFAPTTTGAKNASLQIKNTTGATTYASAALTGTGAAATDPLLTLTPSTQSFGPSVIGTPITNTFTVSNAGASATGPLTITAGGDFTLVPPGAGDCAAGSTLAAGAPSCTVKVRFTPSQRGPRSATLRVSASPGGTISSYLSGTGQLPAQLVASYSLVRPPSLSTGAVNGRPYSWEIVNTGDVPTGTLSRSITGDTTQFTVTDETPACTGSLAAGASCGFVIVFKPTAIGGYSLNVALTAAPGGSVNVTATAGTLMTLTVTSPAAGTGTGNVTTTPPSAIAMVTTPGAQTTDSDTFEWNTVVTLQAQPATSTTFFESWTGDCTGSNRFCPVVMSAPRAATTKFTTTPNNFAFISSTLIASNLANAAAYDTQCHNLASAAGLSFDVNDYVAWVSDGSSNPVTRLSTHHGFVRPDGRALVDTLTPDLVVNHKLLAPIRIDENGRDVHAQTVITGTLASGSSDATGLCTNWTGTGTVQVGASEKGAAKGWSADRQTACPATARIYCFQKSRTAAFTPAVTAGKMIFVTASAFVPGGGLAAADTKCGTEKPAGSTSTFKAILTSSTRSAASLFVPATTYVSKDGQVIGTGADLIAGGFIQSGIWETGGGAFVDSTSLTVRAWTGGNYPGSANDPANTCTDWTSTTGNGLTGDPSSTLSWFNSAPGACSTAINRIYCVEQ